MEIVSREPKLKQRRIILHKSQILHDIDLFSYKLAETSVEGDAKDNVASDSEDLLDGAIISQLMESRDATIRKKLSFCLREESIPVVDNTTDLEGDFIYDLNLTPSFKDSELKTAVRVMHDYMVKGTLMDWYVQIGTSFGSTLGVEVLQLESRIADIFRKPGFVRHPEMIYHKSYRTR